MFMSLLLIILSALDVLFFFLPSPIDPKPYRYGEHSLKICLFTCTEILNFALMSGALS